MYPTVEVLTALALAKLYDEGFPSYDRVNGRFNIDMHPSDCQYSNMLDVLLKPSFKYNAKLERVVDGDTIDAMVDLGFSTWKKVRVRFHAFNAPESRTRDLEEKKRGLLAKARVIEIMMANDGDFILQSHGVGKYGRCLGELFVETLGSVSIQETMISEGHGKEYDGGKR